VTPDHTRSAPDNMQNMSTFQVPPLRLVQALCSDTLRAVVAVDISSREGSEDTNSSDEDPANADGGSYQQLDPLLSVWLPPVTLASAAH